MPAATSPPQSKCAPCAPGRSHLTMMACTQHHRGVGYTSEDNFYFMLFTFVLKHRGTTGGAVSG